MTSVLTYLLQASLGLGLTYAFYRLVLEPSAHFFFNRICLAALTVLSLTLPASPVPFEMAPLNTPIDLPALAEEVPNLIMLPAQPTRTASTPLPFNWTNLLIMAWGLGMVWRGAMLIRQVTMLGNAFRMSQPTGEQEFILRKLPTSGQVFSFGRSIFVGADFDQWSQTEQQQVLAHEQVHLRRGHSFERIGLEVLHMIFWFHPWMPRLKRSWQELQELEADAEVIRQTNPHQYARLLVKAATAPSQLSMAPQMAQSPVTRRIHRILKPGSTAKGRYLALLPLLVLMIGGLGLRFGQAAQVPILGPILTWQEFLPADEEPNIPNTRPMEGRISSGFGMRIHPITKKERMHTGVDIIAPLGTPVYASAAGTVLKSGVEEEKKGYGIKIEIDHGTSGYQSLYAQLSRTAVEPGDEVSKGQLIGYCGSSGLSTGPHLHFAVWKDGRFIDPTTLWPQ